MIDDRVGDSPRHPAWADVPAASWNDWRWQLRNRVTTLAQLETRLALTPSERRGISERRDFSFAVTPYYLSLCGGPECPVRRQAIPCEDELRITPSELRDPLGEDAHSPVEHLTHRYPDRALLYVTHNCPVYCRHCTRSRKVGDETSAPRREELAEAFAYLRRTPEVRDVLVSGGDPLSLSDARLAAIVAELRTIDSVEVVRLCTRNPVTLPQRITPELVAALRPFGPLFVHTHFNHPRECTPEAARALAILADAGFVLGNQMVLLRGINDDAACVEQLNRWLLRQRCRPYYMFQCDPAPGTAHLRTPIETGIEILDRLRGRVSGLAIPQFAVDLPGGGGKITLVPEREVARGAGHRRFRDAFGREFTYVEED
ncbi:MAG: KamA family radical SAM protein [Deltaproteobacteria bacterium]|nr:KamA family radical SAM protein [Deltaproteobacteria bacterium]MBK8717869.1 KamA family radical SAM protein [Deltaproteobacteria bacterium]MBP7287770.1 KamA family radical SAM protein [Nannocystaceae bacterium]